MFPPAQFFINVQLNCNLLNLTVLNETFLFFSEHISRSTTPYQDQSQDKPVSGHWYGFIAVLLRKNRLQKITCPSSYQIHFSELEEEHKSPLIHGVWMPEHCKKLDCLGPEEKGGWGTGEEEQKKLKLNMISETDGSWKTQAFWTYIWRNDPSLCACNLASFVNFCFSF